MRAHANAHSKGYPFARSVTPSPRMTCNISTCAKRTACSRTTWRWNYCCHSMKHDQLAHTERICEQWGHAGVRAASDEKGNIHSNNENNQNKWCAACGCMQTCLGMRMRCSTAEWHGLHGYSGVSVAHDLCMRVRLCACLCGIVGTYLCCHGLRCGSSSRRPGHGRPDSPPAFSVSPCRRLGTGHEKLEGIVRTFGNLPAWNERLEARGAHGMHALRVCTGTKAAEAASANASSGWLRSTEIAS